MKRCVLLPIALFVIVFTTFTNADVFAQKETALPSPLNETSSLTQILDWLNENAFPHARVGLRAKGGTGPPRSYGLARESTPSGERIFSEGFHLKFVNGCHVTLSNEHVAIIDARNRESGSFYRFINQKNRDRELTPQLAMVFLPLDRMSNTRGKGPYLHTKDQDKARLVGAWRTSFEQNGFFRKTIFDAELTAAEQSQTKELGHFTSLTFTFDSQVLAEQFNVVFRRAITICSSKK